MALPSTQQPVQINDFVIERRLGAGGMGIVYLARQQSLNRPVALKVLGGALTSTGDIARFRRAAQAAARLNHPHIAAIYYVGQDAEVCYLAMEYIDGGSFQDVIGVLAATDDPAASLDSSTVAAPRAAQLRFDATDETTDQLTPAPDAPPISAAAAKLRASAAHVRRCVELIIEAARALDYAHGQGVVHRDIKPGNMMLDKAGHAHVIDFGLARFFEDATVTQTGQLVGTPRYMSPEQVTGRLELDGRSDLYSLGLVLYELLTLQPCVVAGNREELLRRIITKPLVPLRHVNPAVPATLEAIVHHATAKDPDDRYQTAAAFADDLERYLKGERVTAPPYRYKADEKEIYAVRPNHILSIAVFQYFVGFAASLFCLWYMVAWMIEPQITWLLYPVGISFLIATASFVIAPALQSGRSWALWACAAMQLIYSAAFALFFRYLSLALNPGFDIVILAGGAFVTVFPLYNLVRLLSRASREWTSFAKKVRDQARTVRRGVASHSSPRPSLQ